MAPHGTTEIDRFDSRVDATPVAVSESRAAFEHWLESTDAGEDAVEELLIVFSELVSNAVHASPDATGEIEASAWISGGDIVLRVANPVAPSSGPGPGPDLADPLRTGGRGLLIVRAYTDTLRTEVDDGMLVVRCTRSIRG